MMQGSSSVKLNIGDVQVVKGPANIVCHGLGSCVALFLFDRQVDVWGGAHIMLPGRHESGNVSPMCYSHNAIEELLDKMARLGSDLKNLQAKVVGGAQVIAAAGIGIGESNAKAVQEKLLRHAVYISAADTGGTLPRTARFSSLTRQVEVTTPEDTSYKLKI